MRPLTKDKGFLFINKDSKLKEKFHTLLSLQIFYWLDSNIQNDGDVLSDHHTSSSEGHSDH